MLRNSVALVLLLAAPVAAQSPLGIPEARDGSGTLAPGRPLSVGLGARGTLNLVPPGLAVVYGNRTPLGAALYLRLAPGQNGMAGMPGMVH